MEIKKISSNPLKYIVNSKYRLTIYSGSLIRIEYSSRGLFDDENPLLIEANFNEDVYHKVKHEKKFFYVSTKYFELKLLPDGNPFDIGNLYFSVKNPPLFSTIKNTFQPGEIDTENLGGAMLDLYKFPEGKYNERLTEGLISKNGYFVFRNHCELLWDSETNWIKKRKDWQFQDWYLFGYGSDFKTAFKDFIKLFGRIPIPPKWVFGYWYSKWYKFTDKQIIELINKFRQLSIPIDVFVIDTDWRKHSWSGYEWNKELFPEPEKFIQHLKAQNIHICLNDHPGYGIPEELPADDPFREKIKSRIPDIREYRINWLDKKYVYTWVEEIFVKFLQLGIDFWWVDGWGGLPPAVDLSAQLWTNKFYFESAKISGDNRRPVILSRWGGIGSHKYPVQFSGDTYSTFETLKYQISFTHKGGNIGASYWSHDIGGFLGGKLPEDLYIRWIEFGCFSPILRTHSSGGERDVWNYSDELMRIFKKYVRIRYALFPYIYTLSRECFDTGVPIIRGLYLEYPNDENAYLNDEEYLIGNSLLVAPAYGPGKIFQREIYFPEGSWIALEGREIINGKCKKKARIPLDKIPVYIKSGSIIPTCSVKSNLSEKITDIEFNIFPRKKPGKCEFVYYEDDGLTEKYLSGEYLTQKIVVEKSKKEIRVEILPATGNYEGCLEEIFYSVNILLTDENPVEVFVNDKKTKIKFTNRIFSQTVNSQFEFLQITPGKCKRRTKVCCIVKIK